MYRHVPRFRYSKESLKIVESTSHAYIRALLHHREYSRLLEVLQEKVNEISSQYFYRLQTKLRECNIFTPVSHSVHRWGMCIPACNGGCLPLCPGGCTRPLADTPRADTPSPPLMTATEASGKHPAGMHSCCQNSSHIQTVN